MPAAILVLALLSLAGIRLSDLEAAWRWTFGLLTLAGAGLLLIVWFLFFTKLSRRVRWGTAGLLACCAGAVYGLVRYDGSADGTAFPKVAWRWTPRKSGEVGLLKFAAGPVAAPTNRTAALDYPGFLGTERNGVVETALDTDWKNHPPRELWRQPVGLGWSGFAVRGSRAITQEQRGANELVVCYDLATGSPLWAHTNQVRFTEAMGGDGPRATPTIEGARVYAYGATGILDCLELETGQLLWSRSVLEENHGVNQVFGKSSSPLLAGETVIVTGGDTNGPSLLAYRAESGAPAWHSGTHAISYSSPIFVKLHGVPQVLVLNAGRLMAHDPAGGQLLWEHHWKEADKALFIASQPVLLPHDRVLLSAGFNAGAVVLQVRAGPDSKFTASEIWKNRQMKTHFSTAVIRDGFAYGLDDGLLACIDLSSGQRQWKDGRYGRGQLLRAGDLLLVQTEPGPVVLVEANPTQFVEAAKFNALSSKTWNNPALAGDYLLVRNDQEAVCFQLPLRRARERSELKLR